MVVAIAAVAAAVDVATNALPCILLPPATQAGGSDSGEGAALIPGHVHHKPQV